MRQRALRIAQCGSFGGRCRRQRSSGDACRARWRASRDHAYRQHRSCPGTSTWCTRHDRSTSMDVSACAKSNTRRQRPQHRRRQTTACRSRRSTTSTRHRRTSSGRVRRSHNQQTASGQRKPTRRRQEDGRIRRGWWYTPPCSGPLPGNVAKLALARRCLAVQGALSLAAEVGRHALPPARAMLLPRLRSQGVEPRPGPPPQGMQAQWFSLATHDNDSDLPEWGDALPPPSRPFAPQVKMRRLSRTCLSQT